MDVLVVGTGEYVTGYVHGAASGSDKGLGVIALILFDLRRRGKVNRILLCGQHGDRFPEIRTHFKTQIASRYSGLDVTIETFPPDDAYLSTAYLTAIQSLGQNSVVIVVTPDDTHYDIATAAIKAGMHVLVAKPLVKTLEEHQSLLQAARQYRVLVSVEMHKRFDPMYADACARARSYGDLSFMSSYMSQPKNQLKTFKTWAGRSSDVSYYLNAHHVDWLVWMMQGRGRPVWVSGVSATGVSEAELGIKTEDTITLTVQWENLPSGHLGISIHTASWIASTSDAHSQQRFFLMNQRGELQVDQAHRGYSTATQDAGYASLNPLFMRYIPLDGKFVGQDCYGYRSIEMFIDAALSIDQGYATFESFDSTLPTINQTLQTTAILQAGRLSLDNGNQPAKLHYGTIESFVPIRLSLAEGIT